jgi:purine-binding chemotaxis protein CheW
LISTLETMTEYVTATVAGQLFGLPIARVQDVFVLDRLTRVPLATPEIAGVLNLRGRIVTAIDMRRRLGLAPADEARKRMAIGISTSAGRRKRHEFSPKLSDHPKQ